MIKEKKLLSLGDVTRLTESQRYPVVEKNRFEARCIDGRYVGADLPALSRPGADAGSLMELLALNHKLNLNLDGEQLAAVLLSVIGGWRRFHFHTDTHHQDNILGCGHLKQAMGDTSAYGLDKPDTDFLNEFLGKVLKKGGQCEVLAGVHDEGAVVVVRGEKWSLAPGGKMFVYHADLDGARRKPLVQALSSIASVKKSPQELYDRLTQVADEQRAETVKRLAAGLPVYEVNFAPQGEFQVKPLF